MRNGFIVAVCLGILWMSYSQAQTPLEPQAPIPADRGEGEAQTRLIISFKQKFFVQASRLNGPLGDVPLEARGRFLFTNGRLISAKEARRSATPNATVCGVTFAGQVTEGELTRDQVRFLDLEISGDWMVRDVFYQTGASTKPGSQQVQAWSMATIPLEHFYDGSDTATPVTIVVQRSYTGAVTGLDAGLIITPSALKSCFGPGVEVLEVPSGH